MHKSIFTIACLVAIAAVGAWAGSDSDTVRVGLSRYNHGTRQLYISSLSRCTIIQTEGGLKLASGTGSFTIEVGASGLVVRPESGGQIDGKSSITVAPDESTGTLTLKSTGIADRKYRGSIEVSVGGGTLKVVNVIAVDGYLLGVLPVEMGESYPREALRAQAITARTYALGNHHKHAAQGFDICDSTHCQTYAGIDVEKSKCSQAVLDTKGMVLTFGGRVAEVMYSTDCGGATVNYCELRPNSNFPYLAGTIDPDDIRHTSWEQVYTLQEIGGKLAAAGINKVEELQSVAVARTGFFGRALDVEVSGKAGKTTVTSDKVRRALGLKSTMFVIEAGENGKVTFKGKGSGHGIGLCQTGAKGLASAPHNYACAQILSHYFPGAQLTDGDPTAALPVKITESTRPTKTVKAGRDPFDVRLAAPDRL